MTNHRNRRRHRVTRAIGLLLACLGLAASGLGLSPAASAQTQPGDIVFAIDESGSMGPAQAAIQTEVPTIASAVQASGVDGQFGLVGYGAGNPAPVVEQTVTADLAAFAAAVAGLTVDGYAEPGYDAIMLSASAAMSPRAGAGLCVVIVTDEPANGDTATEADAIAAVQAVGGTVFGILGTSAVASFSNIIASTGGQVFDLASLTADSATIAQAIGTACGQAIVNTGGGEGCTPGYWKQLHNRDSWNNYSPDDTFDTVFGVGSDATLDEALRTQGGKFGALMRHATAALLNADSPDVDYAYTPSDVLMIVRDAYASGDWKTAKDMLEAANESGCSLN